MSEEKARPWFHRNSERIPLMTIAEIMEETGFTYHAIRGAYKATGIKYRSSKLPIDEIMESFGISKHHAYELVRDGRIIVHNDGTLEKVKKIAKEPRLRHEMIAEKNGITRYKAWYHDKRGRVADDLTISNAFFRKGRPPGKNNNNPSSKP